LFIYFVYLNLIISSGQWRRSWAGDAGDAAASPSKFFRKIWAKFRPIWVKFGQLGKIWVNLDKLGKIW